MEIINTYGTIGKKRLRKSWTMCRISLGRFSPHNNDQEVEQGLATPIQSQECLKTFTLEDTKDEIKTLNQRKSPGLDFITARMLNELSKEGLINLMYIFNAILRLEYWPKSLNIPQIIMIHKPGKNS